MLRSLTESRFPRFAGHFGWRSDSGARVATAGQDRRPSGQARPVLLAAVGREPSDAAVVRKHGAADRRAAAANWIGGGGWQANSSKSGREEQVSEKSLQTKVPLVFLCLEAAAWPS